MRCVGRLAVPPAAKVFPWVQQICLTRSLPALPCPAATAATQEERQAAAEALVAALVDSQKQYDGTHRTKGSVPPGSFDQEAGNRQQRMEECLSCCSPLMVRHKGRRLALSVQASLCQQLTSVLLLS
jgi:hypothetical protein